MKKKFLTGAGFVAPAIMFAVLFYLPAFGQNVPLGNSAGLIVSSGGSVSPSLLPNISLPVGKSDDVSTNPFFRNIELATTTELIAVKESPIPEGGVQRIKTVRVPEETLKYPYLQITETVATNPVTGFSEVIETHGAAVDHIIVKLKSGTRVNDLLAINKKYGTTIRRKLRASGPGTYLIELPKKSGDAVADALEKYRGETAVVASAEADMIVQTTDVFPNDSRFSELWGLHNTGQNNGTSDADIDAPEAWQITTGSKTVKVAVIDTGIDYNHPDLKNNIWINPGEIFNGKDDDGNGFIDDIRGWDFVMDRRDAKDDNGHGTHVSGTIGAVGNNLTGVTGVNWNVSIVPLKFLNKDGAGYVSDAIEAIDYATKIKVDIMSNSWGGGPKNAQLYATIDAADKAGILFVAAAGNNGGNGAGFPAAYDNPNIISVAASDRNDALASFSNYHKTVVDLAAPGVDILSTFPLSQTLFLKSRNLPVGYGSISGTSMATPQVAGVAALIKAKYPAATHYQIKQMILGGVDFPISLDRTSMTDGRLNALTSLELWKTPRPIFDSVVIDDDSAGGTSGDGNKFINPGERIGLWMSVKNIGTETARGVTGTIALAEPNSYVSITQNTATFGDVLENEIKKSSTQFLFEVASAVPTPKDIHFNLTLRDSEGRSWTTDSSLFTIYTMSTVSGMARHNSAPISGAEISYVGQISGKVTTDQNGAYSFALVDGVYKISARKSGFARIVTEIVVPPSMANVDFSFADSVIRGKVIDEKTGKPVAGAKLGYMVLGGNFSGSVVTGSDGRYAISVTAASSASMSLHAQKKGYFNTSSKKIVLSPSVDNIDFSLQPGGYEVIDLGEGYATAINESGQIVGNDNISALFWDKGDKGDATRLKNKIDYLVDINNAAKIIGYQFSGGYFINLERPWYQVLLDGKTGEVTFLYDKKKGDFGGLYSINDKGQIVGWARDSANKIHAFLWEDGVKKFLEDPPMPEVLRQRLDWYRLSWKATVAYDGNEEGKIIGNAGLDSHRLFYPILWDKGKIKLLEMPEEGGVVAYLSSINESGQIVGYDESGYVTVTQPDGRIIPYDLFRSFLWDEEGGIISLGELPLPARQYLVSAINDKGQAIGRAFGQAEWGIPNYVEWYDGHGFLSQDGLMTDLHDFLAEGYDDKIGFSILLGGPFDINNAGQIVGGGGFLSRYNLPSIDPNLSRGFLLNPVSSIQIPSADSITIAKIPYGKQIGGIGIQFGRGHFQSFRASGSSLTGVSFALSAWGGGAPMPVSVDIMDTPGGPSLGNVVVTPQSVSQDLKVPTWISATFPTPLKVEPNNVYYLQLSYPDGFNPGLTKGYRWTISITNPYPHGHLLTECLLGGQAGPESGAQKRVCNERSGKPFSYYRMDALAKIFFAPEKSSSSAGSDALATKATGNVALGNGVSNLAFSQSFKPAKTSLTDVSVALSRSGTPSSPITFAIRDSLTGASLASMDIVPSGLSTDYKNPTWVTANFPTSLSVNPGTLYYLTLSVATPDANNYYRWSVDTANPYPNGNIFKGTAAILGWDGLAKIGFNVPPTVDAGSNQTITFPASVALDGTATDDGLPNPPGALSILWSKVSGPGTVTFSNSSLSDTTASFSSPGAYVLRLTAGDSLLSAGDEITITVIAPVSVGMTAPEDAGVVSGTVTVSAATSDDTGVAKVEFFRDANTLIGTDTAAPYSVSWNSAGVPNGSHTLFAKVTDLAGTTALSSTIVISVDNVGTPPPPPPPATGELTIAVKALGNVALNSPQSAVFSQSFKPTGTSLTSATVALARFGSPSYPITFAIRDSLTGANLTSTTITPSALSTDFKNPTWVTANFPASLSVNPGTLYYLTLSVATLDANNYYRWSIDTANPYPDGNIFKGATATLGWDGLAKIGFGAAGAFAPEASGNLAMILTGMQSVLDGIAEAIRNLRR